VSGSRFDESSLEGLAWKFNSEASEGVGSVGDLERFTSFDLGALGEFLALCAAAKRGLLDRGASKQPVRLVLPSSRAGLQCLYRLMVFQFSVSTGGFLWGDNDHARAEIRASVASYANAGAVISGFKQITPPSKFSTTREAFHSQCQWMVRGTANEFSRALSALGYPQDEIQDFWIPNYEIMENIHWHSGSWGFCALAASMNGMTIFFGDVGRGIRTTLEHQKEEVIRRVREAYKDHDAQWSDLTAILGAFLPGVTSKPGESEGQGLDLSLRYVKENHGTLTCRSGTSRVRFKSTGFPLKFTGKFIPGVQITIFLPTRTT
jgi:hypothetical protein